MHLVFILWRWKCIQDDLLSIFICLGFKCLDTLGVVQHLQILKRKDRKSKLLTRCWNKSEARVVLCCAIVYYITHCYRLRAFKEVQYKNFNCVHHILKVITVSRLFLVEFNVTASVMSVGSLLVVDNTWAKVPLSYNLFQAIFVILQCMPYCHLALFWWPLCHLTSYGSKAWQLHLFESLFVIYDSWLALVTCLFPSSVHHA